METTGKLYGVTKDWKTGKAIVSFAVDHITDEGVNELARLDSVDVIARKHRDKRSLNANSYFHVLCTKIAEAVGDSLQSIKNRLIREYGQYEYIDGQIPTYLIKSEYEEQILKKEGVHFCPVGYEHLNGCDYVRVAVMRGSHTYDSKEMSRLIDGTVEEAKELGIETLTPDQLERMKASWGNGE